MKILFVPDVDNWAIGHLAHAKARFNKHHTCKVVAVHPRDAQEKAQWFYEQVTEFNPDIIVYEYFRSCAQLIEAKPDLKKYKSILVHHNQRDKALFHANWNELGIDILVTHTSKARMKLNEKGYINVETIQHGIDQSYFTYSDKEPEDPMVGYVGRVVPWKGLKEVAQACHELGYPLQMMGKLDKMDYWETVVKDPLRFDFFDCPDAERINAYRSMTVYVGNSEDNYEEGTLPLLEAMACGVPIVSTPNGVAADILKDEYNALIVDFGDYNALKEAIARIMADSDLRKELRKNAWQTVRMMTEEKMAYEYSRLFHKMMFSEKEPLMSFIIPTYNRKEQVIEILQAIENQTYKHIEAVVCDDNSNDGTEEAVIEFHAQHPSLTLKYINTKKDGYNLAMARNMGVIEAEGEYLIFLDSRLKPDENTAFMFKHGLEEFGRREKMWVFGDKGSQKKAFVENFSAVRRSQFINFGMFSERIDKYGGLSQETRTRWVNQKGDFIFIPTALCTPMISSGMSSEKKADIRDMKFRLYKMYGNEAH